MKHEYTPRGTGRYQPHRLRDLVHQYTEEVQHQQEECPRCHKLTPSLVEGYRDGKASQMCGACAAGF